MKKYILCVLSECSKYWYVFFSVCVCVIFIFNFFFLFNRLPEGSEPQDPPPVMVIGNNNVFEVDSYCQASKIGDNNILEAKSKIFS